MADAHPEPLPEEIGLHYSTGVESGRLSHGHGVLELARTQELLARYLPAAPAVVLDVGGGPGTYACWLAARGYSVSLIDAVALHVEQARQASARQPETPLADARVGDARRLDEPGGAADAVLLMGPLYHLTERPDRLAALAEARRVLKPGGVLVATAISRFASLFAGLAEGLLDDPDYRRIVEQDLRDGQHRNPTPRDYFTTSFFHRPEELGAEVLEAGFALETLLGLEGPGWLLSNLAARWADPAERAHLLDTARAIESEPSLLGLGPHILAVARRP